MKKKRGAQSGNQNARKNETKKTKAFRLSAETIGAINALIANGYAYDMTAVVEKAIISAAKEYND